jgi:hypothetical protein
MAPPFRWHTTPRDNNKDGIQDDDDDHDDTAAIAWQNIGALLRSKRHIVVLTGAGISVSCGIPDFRSKNSGLYHTLNATVRCVRSLCGLVEKKNKLCCLTKHRVML